jgi:hypothetical protein
LALAATFALFAVASFLPGVRLWGLNHLAFYQPWVRFGVLVVTGLFLLPPLASATWRGILWVTRPYFRGIASGHNALALTGVASFVIFAAFRASTMLLGDGYFIINSFKTAASRGMSVAGYFSLVTVEQRIYPATELLNYAASWTAGRFGASTAGGVWILNCMIGAAVVVGVLLAVRHADWPDAAKLAVSALVVATGAIQLFFGYVEQYTPALALGALYVLLSFRVIDGRSKVWKPGLVMLVAALFHVQALLLAPSYLWLLSWTVVAKRRSGARVGVVVGILTVVAAAAAAFVPDLGRYYMPPLGAAVGNRLFSGAHLLDVANELLLLCPVWLLYAVLVVGGWRSRPARRGSGDGAREAFAWTLTVPAVLFLVLFRPDLGMARDWDLFAFTVFGLAAPGILAVIRYALSPGQADRKAAVLSPAVVIAAAIVFSWVGVNADSERSVARYRAILQYDLTSPGYAYETLARHFEDNFQYARQMEALSKAYETSGNPRYLLKVGRTLYDNNDTAGATRWFRRYLEVRPEDDDARKLFLSMLASQNRVDEMIPASLAGIERSPRVPDFHFFLGNAYLAKGMTDEGLKAFADCRRLDPPPAMVQAMNRLIEQAGAAPPANNSR